MIWLYRLQQRLAITNAEGTALLVLAFLFFLGLGVRLVLSRPEPVPEGVYAGDDRLFAEGAALLGGPDATGAGADSAAVAGRPVTAPPRIDLNTATAAELQTLPRIGPRMAERIVAYREENGPFAGVRDLLRIRGIGEKTLARLEPHVFVEAPE